MTADCPTSDCTIDTGGGTGVYDVLLHPPAWAVDLALAVVLVGVVLVAWRLHRDGLDRATKRRVLENNVVLFCALVGTGLLGVWWPLWAAAVVGGPGGYLLGMRAAGVASAELWGGDSAGDGVPEPAENPEHG